MRPAAASSGCGVVRLHESSGEVMVALGCTAESGVMTVFGPLGEQAVMIASAEKGGVVVACDENGAPKANFPE